MFACLGAYLVVLTELCKFSLVMLDSEMLYFTYAATIMF
jgi:hypothetical protein